MSNVKQKKIVSLPKELRSGIKSGLLKHGKVKVVGLGIFETRRVPARPGRNPQTGDIVKIPSYIKIKFRPTKQLKEAIC
ncbi:MAG: HU family DNA-binding protein [Candidatus Saccharimonadales bacterium]